MVAVLAVVLALLGRWAVLAVAAVCHWQAARGYLERATMGVLVAQAEAVVVAAHQASGQTVSAILGALAVLEPQMLTTV